MRRGAYVSPICTFCPLTLFMELWLVHSRCFKACIIPKITQHPFLCRSLGTICSTMNTPFAQLQSQVLVTEDVQLPTHQTLGLVSSWTWSFACSGLWILIYLSPGKSSNTCPGSWVVVMNGSSFPQYCCLIDGFFLPLKFKAQDESGVRKAPDKLLSFIFCKTAFWCNG